MTTPGPETTPAPAAAPGTGGTDLERSERWIIRNGMGIQIMETLAVGAFLTAFALELGATNLTIGMLAAVPHLSQLFQVPALLAVERVRKRRLIYSWSGWVARPMLLVIATCAFLPPGESALTLLFLAFAIRYAAGAFLSCAWNSWMRDLVPDRQMGRIFSKRQRSMTLMGVVMSLIAAAFVDLWAEFVPLAARYGYAVVYVFAFAGGAYSVWAARRVIEPPMAQRRHRLNVFVRLWRPLQKKNFRRLLAFLASWNFAINLAAPFFTVHMLKRMELSVTMVVAFTTLSSMATWFTVTRWGAIADRFSNKSVLRVCGPLFIGCIFAWTFTMAPERHALTLPLLALIHIFTGVAAAGVTLSSSNITMKLAPKGNATSFLATSAICNALAAGTASVIGGLTADLFTSREFSIIARWVTPGGERDFNALNIQQWDFFFLSAAVVGLYSLHRLSLVQEDGHVEERVVLSTIAAGARRSVRNLSSIAGLRMLTEFPMDLLGRRSQDIVADDSTDVAQEGAAASADAEAAESASDEVSETSLDATPDAGPAAPKSAPLRQD